MHVYEQPLVNYLDDFLFVALLRAICQGQMEVFQELCNRLGIPLKIEKTVWPTGTIVFLGLLIDAVNQLVLLPREKIIEGLQLLEQMLSQKKTTVHQLQKLTGFLNFLGRAIVPGRAFTRRMYAYTKSDKLKKHHHVHINGELRSDMTTWREFLQHPSIFARPFLDYNSELIADEIFMLSDSAGRSDLSYGAICQESWMYGRWNSDFIKQKSPSIEYLELWALVAGVKTWIHRFKNQRVVLFCDNMSVVQMINNTTSSCRNCMVLIRMFVLETLVQNVRVFARHITSKNNFYCDALSRLELTRFWKLSNENNKKFELEPTNVPSDMWPISKIWIQ